jgi:hypothetical protein
MDELVFRAALPEDKGPLLEIAAQIWEGDDYLPDVIEDWLASHTASLIVAQLGGRVVGLARYDHTGYRGIGAEGSLPSLHAAHLRFMTGAPSAR